MHWACPHPELMLWVGNPVAKAHGTLPSAHRPVEYLFGQELKPIGSQLILPDMELRHLRYFIAVAEHRSFTRAALQLNIAGPPLSRQIQQLEGELGMRLFRRDRRRVELTEAGGAFLPEAKLVVAQSQRAIEVVRVAARGEIGLVKVGIGAGLAALVQRVLVEHQTRFRDVQVECEDLLSSFQNEALVKRAIDVGFLRPPIVGTELQSEVLFKERMTVLLSSAHPLAKRKKLRLQDVADEPLLLHDRSASIGMHDQVLELYRRAGIEARVQHLKAGHCDEARLALVSAGKGIYVGTGVVVNHEVYGSLVTVIPLDEADASVDVLMAWRKNEESAATFAFLDSARKVCRAH